MSFQRRRWTASILTVFILLLLSHKPTLAVDAKRVVLMIALEDPYPNSLQRQFTGQKLEEQLAREFYRSFYKGFDVRVIYHADQSDLWRELHEPVNAGVFWLSHSGDGGIDSNGTTSPTVIIDTYGVDVAPIIASAKLSPQLRFLGVMGCSNKSFIDELQFADRHKNSDLVISSFDRRIRAKKSLKLSIDAAQKTLGRPSRASRSDTSAQDFERDVPRLRITRQLPLVFDGTHTASLRIEWKGEVLAVFPPGVPGQSQTIEIKASVLKGAKPHEMTFVANSGIYRLDPKFRPELGQIFFSVVESTPSALAQVQWSVIELGGRPLGATQHVYKASIRP